MTLLAYSLAFLIGVSLGLLGGGGSILTVPVFAYLLGFPPKEAIAMSLPVVGIGALAGVASHWRAGRINLRVAIPFAAVAMAASFAAARLSRHVSGQAQMLLLAVVVLAAAGAMLRNAAATATAPDAPRRPAEAGGRRSVLLGAAAVGVGTLTGLIGVGGGFLIVPALVLVAGLPMAAAVPSSLLVIALNAFTAWAGHADGTAFPVPFLARFTAVVIGGILAGTALVPHVPARALKRAFALFLLLVGAFVLWQNRAVFA